MRGFHTHYRATSDLMPPLGIVAPPSHRECLAMPGYYADAIIADAGQAARRCPFSPTRAISAADNDHAGLAAATRVLA